MSLRFTSFLNCVSKAGVYQQSDVINIIAYMITVNLVYVEVGEGTGSP